MQRKTTFSVIGWLLLVLAGILLSGCDGSTPRQKTLPPSAKILAFGDSLTFGRGVLPEENYPARLQSAIHRDVINGGLPGEVSVEGLKRLPIWLDEYEPNFLILCHGANDLLRSLSDDKVRENLRGMVKMAKDRGIDVILIAVPKFGGMRSAPGFYADIAREFNIPLENRSLEEILRHAKYQKDTVHPNPEGYQLIADALVKLMKASGAL
jgi:lysophospholipase L1-like esterase